MIEPHSQYVYPNNIARSISRLDRLQLRIFCLCERQKWKGQYKVKRYQPPGIDDGHHNQGDKCLNPPAILQCKNDRCQAEYCNYKVDKALAPGGRVEKTSICQDNSQGEELCYSTQAHPCNMRLGETEA